MRARLCLLPRGTSLEVPSCLPLIVFRERIVVVLWCFRFVQNSHIYIRSCVDRVDISFFSLREGWMSSFDFLLDPILVYLNVSKDKKQAAAKWRYGSSSPLDLLKGREREKEGGLNVVPTRALHTLHRSSNVFLAQDVRSNARKHLFIVDIPCATRTVQLPRNSRTG